MYFIRFLLLLVVTGTKTVFAQDNFTLYAEPTITLNYEVATNYSHNFEVANRSYIYDEDLEFRARHLELTHFSNLNIGFDQSIAFGIKYRWRENFEENEENELRLTEQYNLTHRNRNLRLGNRFRAEQRILPSSTAHRFRYRFALDTPLSGEQLDVGEAYFVISTEALLSAAKSQKPEFDQRLTSQIGWLVNPETKLQTGLEYRIENYGQSAETVMLLLASLVFSL